MELHASSEAMVLHVHPQQEHRRLRLRLQLSQMVQFRFPLPRQMQLARLLVPRISLLHGLREPKPNFSLQSDHKRLEAAPAASRRTIAGLQRAGSVSGSILSRLHSRGGEIQPAAP